MCSCSVFLGNISDCLEAFDWISLAFVQLVLDSAAFLWDVFADLVDVVLNLLHVDVLEGMSDVMKNMPKVME